MIPAEAGLISLALVHAGATWFLAGLVWFVQLVHYPLLARVGTHCPADYHSLHARPTTRLVVPVMAMEGASAVLLLALHPPSVPSIWLALGTLLALVIWFSTALIQVPAHQLLGRTFQAKAHRRLMRSNWIRTVAWSARGVLSLAILLYLAG